MKENERRHKLKQKFENVEETVDLVKSFCLFDLSYGNYDKIEVKEFNIKNEKPEGASEDDKKNDAIKLSRGIGTRFPDESVRKELKKKIREIQEALKDLLKLEELIKVDEKSWKNYKEIMERLFKAMNVKGLRPTSITKILHRFAPEMIPILDNESMPSNYDNKKPDNMELALELINGVRKDISENPWRGEGLSKVQKGLKDAEGIQLSKLRIFDILLWAMYREDKLNKEHVKSRNT